MDGAFALFPLKIRQTAFILYNYLLCMLVTPKKKRRCIQKTPDGDVEEICTAMEGSRPRGEETEEQLRMKGVD
ncbi:hypothetical protein CUJ83_00495 [Methanocella sp. CWC-04]|uniref:Uncharacterized protein n=1 Tax=Methanooceanicella nereidis TaxID=2052831 RepID=A0AAP2W3T4_9EURY|nr:hypothetical protein [Methanocella sp. CWC-04]MCD1293475.1 hypothetical protein [Methanocella sp. CWC-04]